MRVAALVASCDQGEEEAWECATPFPLPGGSLTLAGEALSRFVLVVEWNIYTPKHRILLGRTQ